METRICKKCSLDKEIQQFYKNKKLKDGYESKCKSCVLEERNTKKDRLDYENMSI
jgi:superfamily II helicase